MTKSSPNIALVLGAGSARGLAHIGVLEVLEKNNIPVDLIVGCSMGAMVGSIYACGTDICMLEKLINNININHLFDINLPRMGLVEGKRITEFLELMTKNMKFENLKIPLIVIATDLKSSQRIIMDTGIISEAVRASISIPGVFHPVIKDDMVLVDGAVLDRLPIDIAREKGAQLIIGVDVNYSSNKQVKINNTKDVILYSLDLMQKNQDNNIQDSDILIQPEVGNFSPADFNKVSELIQLGRIAAEKNLPQIKAALR